MANKDFVVKNGLVTGTNNVTVGNSVYIITSGNVGIHNSAPAHDLSVNGLTFFGDSISSSINLSANSTGVYHTGTINAASHTVGTSTVANATGVYTGVVNATSVNAASHTVGTSTVANSTGVYTGVVNGSSITVGTSTIANVTGVYTGVVNATSVNAASHTVGTSTVANSTGVYTGIVNAASHTVGTSTVANSTGVYTGVVNGSSITVGTSTISNSTGVYTGVVNATTISTGSVNVLNASGLTTSANISVGAAGEIILTAGAGISANGAFGSAGEVLHSNGSSVYWSTDDQGVTSVASGNGISGGTITSTGTLSVVSGTGTVVNTTGVHVNATYIATLTANNTSFVGSVSAANVVSNSQLSSNLANYQTTAGLNANIASYLPNYSGVINATAINSANLTTTTNNVTIGSSSYFVSNGNIGVGTASPTEKLEVNGNLKVSDNIILNGDNITPFAGFKNKIINGNFDFWQRGTSFSNPASGGCTADRFAVSFDGSGATRTISRQAFTLGQTDVPNEPTYFLRFNQSVAGTGGTYNAIVQNIEGVRTLAGQTITLSFYAKAASALTMPSISIRQYFGSGGSPSASADIIINNVSVGTSWTKYTYTFTLASISGKTLGTNGDDFLALILAAPFNTTFTFDLAQVQVEAGSVATPFEMRPQQVELALCQRYFSSTTLFVGQSGFYATSYTFSSTMRVTPTRTGGGAGYNQALLNSYGICFSQTTPGQQAFTFDAEL